MYRLNHGCWIWSPRPPPCFHPQHSGSLASGILSLQEEEGEEARENPSVCCYTTGCHDVISQAVEAQQSTSEPPTHSGIPSSSGLAGRSPGVLSSQQPATVIQADEGNVEQHFTGCYWDGPERQTQSCVCVFGDREPEHVGHCWPGSPYICFGVRRNLVVGVEVVEEVAIEDTVEVLTGDVYTDDLLDPELLHEDQLYPT